MKPDISIVTIFFKEEKNTLINFLLSLEKNCLGVGCEIILVNCSEVFIADLEKNFPDLKIISNHQNIGVATARNQAVAIASGELLLFLDADMEMHPECLKKACNYLNTHEDIGGVGLKIVYPDGKPQYSFGKIPSRGFIFQELLMMHRPVAPIPKEPVKVEFLGGGTLLVKRSVWEKVGGLDENFSPYGWEDADWCRRAAKLKVKLYYYPDAVITHYLHQSVSKTGARQVEFYLSGIYYYKKHFGKIFAVIVAFFILIHSLLRIIISLLRPERGVLRRQLLRLVKGILLFKI